MTGSDPHCDDCVTTILHKLQCFAQGRNEGLLLKGCTQQFSMLLSPQKLAWLPRISFKALHFSVLQIFVESYNSYFSEDRITTSRGQGFFPLFFGPHVGNMITLNHFIKKSLDVICTMPWYCWPAHIWLLPTLKPPSYVRTRFSMPPNWYTHAQTKQRGICYGSHTPVYKPTIYLHAWCSKSLKDNWKGFLGFTSSD